MVKTGTRLGLLWAGLALAACTSADSSGLILRPTAVRPLIGRWRESSHGRARFHIIRMQNGRLLVNGRPASYRGGVLSFQYEAPHMYSGMLNREYKLIMKYTLTFDAPSLLEGEQIMSVPEDVPSPDGYLPAHAAGTTESFPIKWERIESTLSAGAIRDPLVGTWEGTHSPKGFRKRFDLIITLEQGVYKVNGYSAHYKGNALTWTVRERTFEQRWRLAFQRSVVLTGYVDKIILSTGQRQWRGKAAFTKKSARTWVD